MRIAVCFSSDANYAQPLAVTLASIFHHKSAEDELFIYVLDGGIRDEDKAIMHAMTAQAGANVRFLPVGEDAFSHAPLQALGGTHSHITKATYYRILLAELLPQEDNVIYLDCDLICKSSLADLYAQGGGGEYWICGVPDIAEQQQAQRLGLEHYVNAGVLLINLKAWREHCVQEKCMAFIRDHADIIVLNDQDVLNMVCKGHISLLDDTWNLQSCKTRGKEYAFRFGSIANSANIIHFIGSRKPWHIGCRLPLKNEYFIYLKLTPYYKDFMRKYRRASLQHFLYHSADNNVYRRWYLCGVRVWKKKEE